MRTGRLKRGFTLVETVVTVGIISALAAVVYPTVVKQFDSADPTKAAEDLGNIRTGISAFGINVRPQYPSDIEDLVNQPVVTGGAGGDSTSKGALFTSAERINWLGPYVALSVSSTAGQADTVAITGFSGRIMNRIHPYDVGNGSSAGDTVSLLSTAADFLAIRVVSLSGAAFNAVNLLIDGPTETTFSGRRELGRFRCPITTETLDSDPCKNAYFLAVPVR